MLIEKTTLEGVLVITPKRFMDDRGYFYERYQSKLYDAYGITGFVQDNVSCSKLGVLRGMHFQRKNPQGKLVGVLAGRVYDVVVDIRPTSEQYGKWFGVELSEANGKQLWVPKGFAHGFLSLEDKTIFSYKCTDFYYPEDQHILAWDDPEVGIEWPGSGQYEISPKDLLGEPLRELLKLVF